MSPEEQFSEKPVASGFDNRPALRAARSGTRLLCVAFICMIALQFALFRSYAEREVTWAHPTAFDQASYLQQSYEGFERQLSHGLLQGTRETLTIQTPNGVFLPVQAALLYQVFGASRLSSLTLLFLYLVAGEAMILAAAWFLTRSALFALAILALYLLSDSRFFWAGGIFDFRIDSIAASLYCIFICLMIRSRAFESLPLSLACGIVAGLLVLFRFAAFAFLVGYLAACGATLYVILRFSRDPDKVHGANLRLRSVVAVMLTTMAIAGPLLLWNSKVIIGYYGRHVGSEQHLRAIEQGIFNLRGHLLYYPHSLQESHLGRWFFIAAALLVATALFARARSKGVTDNSRPPTSLALAFCVFSIMVPLAELTVDPAKSPVVANILVGPITMGIALAIKIIADGATLNRSRVFGVVCGIVIAAALVHELSAVSTRSFVNQRRSAEQHLLETYDAMLVYAAQAGWDRIQIAVDRTEDYFTAQSIAIVNYEKTGNWLPPSYALGGTIDRIPEIQAIEGLRNADFAILTTFSPGDSSVLFPFDRQMIGMEPRLWAEAKLYMSPIRTLDYAGHQMTIFARPAVAVEGTSGPWLMPDGASLRMPCGLLSGRHALVAGGRTILPEMLHGQLSVKAVLQSGTLAEEIPAAVSPVTSTYSLTFRTDAAHFPTAGTCYISLSFDRYFIPKERGINADTRKLVIMAPSQFRFE